MGDDNEKTDTHARTVTNGNSLKESENTHMHKETINNQVFQRIQKATEHIQGAPPVTKTYQQLLGVVLLVEEQHQLEPGEVAELGRLPGLQFGAGRRGTRGKTRNQTHGHGEGRRGWLEMLVGTLGVAGRQG